MKTIIITGPSGSGKTYLSSKLSKIFYNSIVIKTDSYYRDNIFIRFSSLFIYDIYDRLASIKKDKIKKTLRSIDNKNNLISFDEYDFKRKNSSQSKIYINYKRENQFLILEGIFAHRLDINYQQTINIVCEEQKEVCFKRRLKRDQLERGRKGREVNKKFNRSWELFYKHLKFFLTSTQVLKLNPVDNDSYNKLVSSLKNQKNN